jgi:rhodanese-related sulfurtransferase
MTYASSADTIAHFSAKLSFETDPSDVAAALADGTADFVLVDVRGQSSWAQGHADGALHIPRVDIAERAAELIPAGSRVVVYCWGPACNGGTKAAIEFAKLGYPVKEMLGGFEYWAREGFSTADTAGHQHRDVDPLTAPVLAGAISCEC